MQGPVNLSLLICKIEIKDLSQLLCRFDGITYTEHLHVQ